MSASRLVTSFLTAFNFYSDFTSNIITSHFFAVFHLYWPHFSYFLISLDNEIILHVLFSAKTKQQMLSDQSPTTLWKKWCDWLITMCLLFSYLHSNVWTKEIMKFLFYIIIQLIYHTYWNLTHAVEGEWCYLIWQLKCF